MLRRRLIAGRPELNGVRNQVLDVEVFIEECKAVSASDPDPLIIRDIVHRAVSNPTSALAGLGEPTGAGFQTLYRSERLTILNYAWAPLMSLLPHNHNDMWAVIGLYSGREDNIFWRRKGDTIEAVGADALTESNVNVLGGNVIHSVINPIPRMTLALHVYGGDFFATGRSEWDPEFLVERPFDVEASAAHFKDANDRFLGK